MTASTRWVIQHACTRKRAVDRRTALRTARKMRAEGEAVSAYRCPFCDAWHVGHVPSLDGLEDLAHAIRDQHGNAPGATS